MNITTAEPDVAAALPPPKGKSGVIGWLRMRLFSSPLNILITILIVWLLLMGLPPLVEWACSKPISPPVTPRNAAQALAALLGLYSGEVSTYSVRHLSL